MSDEVYTVEQVAARLDLHPKTVLRFIHDGRLRAVRFGKAYRILRSDFEALIGQDRARTPLQALSTSIVDVPDIPADKADRLATALTATLVGREARPEAVRLETAFDPARRRLKVVVIAAPTDAAAVLQTLAALLEALS